MINEVIERLKEKAQELVSVDGAEEISALSEGVAPPHRSCFVLPFRERGSENERVNGCLQTMTAEILTAFVLRAYGSAKGGQRVGSEFDQVKASVEGALRGWQISADHAPFELVSGQAGALAKGATLYVQTWRTSFLAEAEGD